MSTFSLFKKASSVIFLTAVNPAQALDVLECRGSHPTAAAISFDEYQLERPDKPLWFDMVQLGGLTLWGGGYTIMGYGEISPKAVNVVLKYASTGVKEQKRTLARLIGEKGIFGWRFKMIPYDNNTHQYLKDQEIELNYCRVND